MRRLLAVCNLHLSHRDLFAKDVKLIRTEVIGGTIYFADV